MKKIICIILCIVSLCACLSACNKNEQTSTVVYKNYQKLSYTDFNNLAMEKGYSPVENTDNTGFNFQKSFSITDDDCYSLIFYQLESKDKAYTYFNYLVQTYGAYTTEFLKHEVYGNSGYYMAKDKDFSVYFSFVDDTLLYAMVFTPIVDEHNTKNKELTDFVKFIQYPIDQFPVFK